jgi:hypothetical protein
VLPDPAAPYSPAAPRLIGRAVGTPVPHPATETLRLYAADWRDFSDWCRTAQRAALPTSLDTLAAYLLACAPRLGRGALGRRRAAIAAMHRQHNLPVPRLGKAARAALRHAAHPSPERSTALPLLQMAARCGRDLTGLRDRALLLLLVSNQGQGSALDPLGPQAPDPDSVSRAVPLTGIQGAAPLGLPFPRASLLGLDAEHVRFTPQGGTLALRTRPDDEVPTGTLVLARSTPVHAMCPVHALEDWLRASNTTFGPAFRKVDRWGNVEHARLGPDAFRQIVRRHKEAGEPRARLAAASR